VTTEYLYLEDDCFYHPLSTPLLLAQLQSSSAIFVHDLDRLLEVELHSKYASRRMMQLKALEHIGLHVMTTSTCHVSMAKDLELISVFFDIEALEFDDESYGKRLEHEFDELNANFDEMAPTESDDFGGLVPTGLCLGDILFKETTVEQIQDSFDDWDAAKGDCKKDESIG
jgi:hypothetical protein